MSFAVGDAGSFGHTLATAALGNLVSRTAVLVEFAAVGITSPCVSSQADVVDGGGGVAGGGGDRDVGAGRPDQQAEVVEPDPPAVERVGRREDDLGLGYAGRGVDVVPQVIGREVARRLVHQPVRQGHVG